MPTFQDIRQKVKAAIRHDHLVLAVLALLIGLTAGGAVIVFREGVGWIQWLSYGTDSPRLYYQAQDLSWWLMLLVPTAGGLLIGLFIHWTLPDRRPHGIADVIEAYARRSGYMSFRTGIAAAVSSAASIGFGASVGREGPAVHLGASLAGWLTRRLH
ncbi:MAG: chloride channel protein, partial [Rhodospirillales bacterium]|nr:chloride channel protein [Rhodospirillales bacterium]